MCPRRKKSLTWGQRIDPHLQTRSFEVDRELLGQGYGGGFRGVVTELSVLTLLAIASDYLDPWTDNRTRNLPL